jgi:hypothetical protein
MFFRSHLQVHTALQPRGPTPAAFGRHAMVPTLVHSGEGHLILNKINILLLNMTGINIKHIG